MAAKFAYWFEDQTSFTGVEFDLSHKDKILHDEYFNLLKSTKNQKDLLKFELNVNSCQEFTNDHLQYIGIILFHKEQLQVLKIDVGQCEQINYEGF